MKFIVSRQSIISLFVTFVATGLVVLTNMTMMYYIHDIDNFYIAIVIVCDILVVTLWYMLIGVFVKLPGQKEPTGYNVSRFVHAPPQHKQENRNDYLTPLYSCPKHETDSLLLSPLSEKQTPN